MVFEAGLEVEFDIADVAYGGRGVGRVEAGGLAVFVHGTLEGERVRARLASVHKRYAEAELLTVLSASAARSEPACPLAGRCGGCAYQHVVYAEEVEIKHRQLAALLTRIGGLADAPLLPPIPASECLGYRNKMVLHVGPDGELGYIGHDKRSVVDVGCCPLANSHINDALRERRLDTQWREGLQHRDSVTFRWTEHDGVAVWMNSGSGGGTLIEKSPAGEMQVPKDGFFQVNPAMSSILMNRVGEWIKEASPEFLMDLYCGCGVFALLSAQSGVPHVLGIEINGPAIRSAKANARRLRHPEITFAEGDAGQLFENAIARVDASRTWVIVDPPREGISGQLVTKLMECAPASIVYVSCGPDTLARDLKRLTAGGFRVARSQLIDLFPRTAHFETITLLNRGNAHV